MATAVILAFARKRPLDLHVDCKQRFACMCLLLACPVSDSRMEPLYSVL